LKTRLLKTMMAGLLCATSLCAIPAPSRAADPLTIQIGINNRSTDPGFANVWIGEPLGFYAAKGLAIDIVGTTGASEDLQLLLTGKLQASTGVQDPVFAAMADGKNLPVVSPCVYQRGIIYRTAVSDDSTIKSFGDLKGKRVGVLSLSSATTPYTNFVLQAAGVDPNTVDIIAVGDGQQAAAALRANRVDALSLADISIAALVNAGVKLHNLPQPPALTSVAAGYVFAFQKPWYEAHKQAVGDFLQAEMKSVVVLMANPEAAVRISYHMFPETRPTGVTLDEAVRRAVNVLSVRLPYLAQQAGDLKRFCEFSPAAWIGYVKLIGLDGKLDPAKFYTNEQVDKANDFNVAALAAWAKDLKVPEDDAAYKSWLAGLKPPV
jgi:NitT/TauT family transport system substrate-binding protein